MFLVNALLASSASYSHFKSFWLVDGKEALGPSKPYSRTDVTRGFYVEAMNASGYKLGKIGFEVEAMDNQSRFSIHFGHLPNDSAILATLLDTLLAYLTALIQILPKYSITATATHQTEQYKIVALSAGQKEVLNNSFSHLGLKFQANQWSLQHDGRKAVVTNTDPMVLPNAIGQYETFWRTPDGGKHLSMVANAEFIIQASKLDGRIVREHTIAVQIRKANPTGENKATFHLTFSLESTSIDRPHLHFLLSAALSNIKAALSTVCAYSNIHFYVILAKSSYDGGARDHFYDYLHRHSIAHEVELHPTSWPSRPAHQTFNVEMKLADKACKATGGDLHCTLTPSR